jgi:hypothetical protein
MIVLRVAALALFALVPSTGAQVANPELIEQAKKEGRVVWYTTLHPGGQAVRRQL